MKMRLGFVLIAGCLVLASQVSPAQKKQRFITVKLDRSMLPMRIIPEKTMDVIIIDKDGKIYSEEAWFKLLK
jgi:hypothetical protein